MIAAKHFFRFKREHVLPKPVVARKALPAEIDHRRGDVDARHAVAGLDVEPRDRVAGAATEIEHLGMRRQRR